MIKFLLGVLAGGLIVSAIGLGCNQLKVEAQSFYPLQGPPWLEPTPQQRFQQQQHERLADAWFRQQLQRGVQPQEPCE